jgi:hypothetical protein
MRLLERNQSLFLLLERNWREKCRSGSKLVRNRFKDRCESSLVTQLFF